MVLLNRGYLASLEAQTVQQTRVDPGVKTIPWRRGRQPLSVVLAWGTPWIEGPGGLQSTGSQRVGRSRV